MRLMINGSEQNVAAATLSELLRALDLRQKYFAVALNGVCVRKECFDETLIREHDEIEILVPMQGG